MLGQTQKYFIIMFFFFLVFKDDAFMLTIDEIFPYGNKLRNSTIKIDNFWLIYKYYI